MNPLYKIATLIFPERCPYCGCLIESEEIACPGCFEILRQKHIPLKSGVSGYRCVSSFVYGGKVRRMIIRMKFHDRTQYIPQIAKVTSDDIKAVFNGICFDSISYVPMHPKDKKSRGYNQSELLAKALSKELSIPCLNTLDKIKRTKKQHTLTYSQRRKNLSGAFKTVEDAAINGKSILIVDDIITSGATLSACCKALKRSNPKMICCATIASAKNVYPENTVI